MSSEWQVFRIEDVAEKVGMGPFGSNIKVETFVEDGIPIISGEHLHDISLTESRFRFITLDHANRLKNSNVFRGDVIFTHAGTIGQVAVIPDNSKYERYVLSQRQFFLRCNREKIHPRFVVYFFKTPEGRHKLLANASQVGVPSISRPVTNLRSIEIPVPPLHEQLAIVGVIEALNQRIALMRETNATLEAIAQAMFKSWFVDFDPVHAKQQGRAPEGMSETTAALFPDSFEESEMGLIPREWKVERLETFMELSYGKALKATERIVGEVPVYGSGGITGYHNESLVNGPSIVIGRKGTVGSLYWEDQPFFPIDTVFYVRSAMPMTYCFYLLQTLGLADMNTDAAVPGLNRNNVYRLKIPMAPEAVLSAFSDVVDVLRGSIFKNNQQAQILATLRDTLLPRLISGQLRLPQAEAALEAVAG